jgi:hypothetical protein
MRWITSNIGVIHVKAQRITPLDITSAVITSHDFH